jgi:hypothetical protein
MNYPGGIRFIHSDCNWGDMDVMKDINFGQDALKAVVWKFASAGTKIQRDSDPGLQLLVSNGSKKGWISLDTEEVKLSSVPDMVVFARSRKEQADGSRYFVLFVKRKALLEYERVGVGMIQEDFTLKSVGRCRII